MKNLNDRELEQELEHCVRRERAAVAEVLRYLREVEARRLFLARGYSSLFAYCTSKLGYSEPEAYLRIQAMRLMTAVPEAEARIETGRLSMSVAAEIQGAARREEMAVPAVRQLVEELSGKSKREAERRLVGLFPRAAKPESARPINDGMVEIRFSVTREEAALLEELLDRNAHSNFERSYRKLFMGLARAEKEKLNRAPKKCGTRDRAGQTPTEVAANPKQTTPSQSNAALLSPGQVPGQRRSRYIPASIKRQIWKRDHGRCQYQDPHTGHRCETKHGLQIDHVHPFALGGTHAAENLRLLCGAHNRWRTAHGGAWSRRRSRG